MTQQRVAAPPESPAAKRIPLWKILALPTVALMGVLVYAALALAPEDADQGPAQRIFYIHVPSAWIAFLAFAVVFVASVALLATGKRKWDDRAVASAEVGVVFTTVVMLTGPLWARPVWGVYWEWDPKLTAVFILWLIYMSYLALRSYVPDPSRRARFSAVLGIAGFLDVPIVYLAVRWWRGLHPEAVVLGKGGPQLPASMLQILLFGVFTFTLLYLVLFTLRLHVGRLRSAQEEVQA
ncbi:MAG: cytochrome c biogenesis protein [Actinomycetota bacterium]